MRRFKKANFSQEKAEALASAYRFDSNEIELEAVRYVSQYVVGGVNSKELVRGYLPEDYADALVEYRDKNSDRDLSAAVNQLCVDGDVSTVVEDFTSFERVTIPIDFETEELFTTRGNSFDNEARKNVKSIADMIREARVPLTVYIPEETKSQFVDQGLIE